MEKAIKKHNKVSWDTGETKKRYKLVKSKRGWLNITLGLTFASMGIIGGGLSVSADTQQSPLSSSQPVTQQAESASTASINNDKLVEPTEKNDTKNNNSLSDVNVSDQNKANKDQVDEKNNAQEPEQTKHEDSSDKTDQVKPEEQKTDEKTHDQKNGSEDSEDKSKTIDGSDSKSTYNVNLQAQPKQDQEGNNSLKVTISDPNYQEAGVPWVDPDESHYTFGYNTISDSSKGNGLKYVVWSIDRNGDDIIHVYELDNNNHVLHSYNLNSNGTKISSNMVDGLSYHKWDEDNTSLSSSNVTFQKNWFYNNPKGTGGNYKQISFLVPETVNQKVTWVDRDSGKTLKTENYTGMAGQHYSIEGLPPEIPNNYYVSTTPSNSSGSISNFGVVGKVWNTYFDNGHFQYTETDDHGGMDVKFLDNNNNELTFNNGQKIVHIDANYNYNPNTADYSCKTSGFFNVLGPIYVPQSRDVKFIVAPLGNLIPVDPSGNPIDSGKHNEPYQIDPNDPTKIKDPKVPSIPGYIPMDPNDPTKSLIPNSDGTYPQNPVTDPGKDTNVPYGPATSQVTDNSGNGSITIHYVNSSGDKVADDKVIDIPFTRTGTRDNQNGNIKWGNWEPTNGKDSNVVKVDSPVITGLTPDQPNVSGTISEGDSKSVTVVYNTSAEKAHVQYVDQDNNNSVIKTDDLDGKFGEKSDYSTKAEITALENQGYELVTDGYPADGYTFTTEDPTYTVVVKHKTKTVTPDTPGTPGQPVDPNNPDGPKYPDGTSKNDLTKDVTRTIHYVDDQGKTVSKDVNQGTNFGREATFDEVTGKVISYTAWTPSDATFNEVNSPVITGYYTDTAKVNSEQVNGETSNSEVTVVYHKLGNLVPNVPGSTPVIYPNNPTNPSESGNPIIPDIPGYTPVDNNGNKLTPGTPYPIDHSQLGKDTIIHYVKNEVPETPLAPQTPEKPSNETPKAPETGNHKDSLPQTGQDASNSLLALIGTALLAFLGLFGLDLRRRK